MDRAFPVKEKKFQQIEGVITGRGHEFLQPGERRSGRVIDSYPIEIGGGSGGGGGMLVGFNPAECDGVALHVRLPADDRILVRHRASIVIKACFASILQDLYDEEEALGQLVEVFAVWDNPSSGFPAIPVRLHNLAGYSEHASQFTFLFKMLDSSDSFSFSGVTVWFLQQPRHSGGFTVFRPVEARLEIITQTNHSIDPGTLPSSLLLPPHSCLLLLLCVPVVVSGRVCLL